jgi:hypothetical protein
VRAALWAFGLGTLVAPPLARAEPAPVWVWYRTSEGCPDGEAFVSRLSELGKQAHLASVGDRVDFVVTLGSGPRESSGRLERQTRSGTVAIREYRDARCEQVAEALALTLDLALEPEAPTRVAAAASRSGGVAAPAAAEPRGDALPSPVANEVAASASVDAAGSPALPSPAPVSAASIALGAQATLVTGVAPGVLPGGALFIAGHTGNAWLSSWRGTLFGGYRESSAAQREIEVLLAGGRIEGCVLELRLDAIALSPCLGLDAGLLRASGPSALGSTDAGLWSAAAAHGRFAAVLAESLSIELQVGGLVPLVRYEMGTRDGSAEWFRTRAIGLDARVGVAWRIP